MKAGCLTEFKTRIREGASINEIKAFFANHLMIRYGTVYPKDDAIIGLGRGLIRKGLTIEVLERLFHMRLRENGYDFERLRQQRPANWSYNTEKKLVIKNGTEEEVFPDIYWYVIYEFIS